MQKWLILPVLFICSNFFSVTILNAQTIKKIKGNDVVINGDSFFALSGEIKSDLEKLARTDGYIGSGESFRNAAVSGAMLDGITNQYANTNPKPVYVIMDGGGNNVLLTSCSTPPTVDCAAIKTAISYCFYSCAAGTEFRNENSSISSWQDRFRDLPARY